MTECVFDCAGENKLYKGRKIDGKTWISCYCVKIKEGKVVPVPQHRLKSMCPKTGGVNGIK